MRDHTRTGTAPGSSTLWWAYAVALLAIGLLLGVSELQHYLRSGGRHVWEPFLWELSSMACIGPLGLLVYRWHVAGLARPRLNQLGRHALGAVVYMLLHVGGMFGLRWAVYGLAGVGYDPGPVGQILAYEAGKDLVSYGFIVGVCHGLWLYFDGQRRQQDLARLRRELAEAHLSRLTEQIQPHFLFNTLNMVSAVMYEDVQRADRILCDLAQLLRQALTAQAAGVQSLAEELTLVEPYLNIMRARFGARLSISIEVSAEADGCLLPSLLLISPVENAIKHDVALTSAPVSVGVRGWVERGVLNLCVTNSGSMPERTHREGAVGLANTRARLQALYGTAAELHLGPGLSGGGLLHIRMPARR